MEKGSPSPYVKDATGKAPIHVAAAKIDMETFETLVSLGCDPLTPDAYGNTFLHMLTQGTVRENEFVFIRDTVSKYRLRLTRNFEGLTPLQIIQKNSGKSAGLRGLPNYRRKVWEFFEQYHSEEATFIDEEGEYTQC